MVTRPKRIGKSNGFSRANSLSAKSGGGGVGQKVKKTPRKHSSLWSDPHETMRKLIETVRMPSDAFEYGVIQDASRRMID
jgi:hypothetical protein